MTSPGPSHSRPGWPAAGARLARRAAVGAATLQVVVGTLWWCRNLAAVPPYGDTPEYLRLSETLAVDEFRTIAYPAAVRVARHLDELGPVPWQVWLYLTQTALAIAAAWWVVRTLTPAARRGRTAFAAAVVVTSPLVVHYATSVLSDSAAASLFAVALAGAARIVVRRQRAASTWVVTALASFGAAALRTEKATVLVATAALVAVVVVVVRRGRRTGPRAAPAVLALGLVLVVPAGIAAGVNGATQTADIGRTHGGPVTIAFSRVVWPHLGEIRTTLAPEAQAVVTAQDAAVFDADYNNVLPMIDRLRALDGGGDRYTMDAVRAAARCCGLEAAGTALGDAAEYAVTPVTFLVEGTQTLAMGATNTATTWNITRMTDHDPGLSTVLLWTGFAVLALLLLAAALTQLAARDDDRRARTWSAVLVLAGTVVNGCLFAVAQGADTNVRYGLANAMVITAITVAWTLVPGRPEPSRARDRAASGEGARGGSRPTRGPAGGPVLGSRPAG